MSRSRSSRFRIFTAMVIEIGLITITQGADQRTSKPQPAKPAASASPAPSAEATASSTAQTAVEKALAAPADFDFV